MAEKRVKRKRKQRPPHKQVVERHHRIIWSRPSPNSVYKLAADAMRRANDQILESLMRRLARAEANGVSKMLSKDDVIVWLDELEAHIQYLREYLATHESVQTDIEEMLPPEARRRCDWCGGWFVPSRSTARFCKDAHRVAAHRQSRREQGLPYH